MRITFGKKIKGLCYVEDVLDEDGLRIAKIIFDNNCRLINDANDYLKELRITRTSSYNSINRFAYDLSYFYDFLILSNTRINEIDYEVLNIFIEYLTRIKKENRQYAIEKTLLKVVNVEKKSSKVFKIRKFGNLSDDSIFRIFNRAIDYLEFLSRKDKFIKTEILHKLKNYKDRKRFIGSAGIHTEHNFIANADNMKLITEEQINSIKNYASKKNDYIRFLTFILEVTGMRIGEALGLKIESYDSGDIKNIIGDIYFKDGVWKVKIWWDINNPDDSLSKSRKTRILTIAEKDKYEFEGLLERYMKYRKKTLETDRNKMCFLFISNRGTKLSYDTASKRFKRILNIVCPEATDVTYHSYRHSLATNKILEGYPLEFIAMMLGHSSPFITYEIYVHFSGEDMKNVRKEYSHYMEKLLKRGANKHGTYK